MASSIRAALAEHDRETTAIMIARETALRFRDEGYDLQRCIDVGLRVGLAILTEAVLVAPLEGISEVRLLSNMDGSTFLSVHFTGPIRAAGGTAQALAVLIADTIRSEFDIGRYVPTDPEVERVKEEFGLYRGNLQYRPTPEEIDVIVRACPIMINGESTETIECAGYGRVRNIDEPRIRGGVLLVIGEGMVLKAPKIQKHTERLNVPGWDFISNSARRVPRTRAMGPRSLNIGSTPQRSAHHEIHAGHHRGTTDLRDASRSWWLPVATTGAPGSQDWRPRKHCSCDDGRGG